jgi:hypothetical protein
MTTPFEPNRIMIDLETFDTTSNPVIISIGAVRFTLDGIRDTFYRHINPQTCLNAGLTLGIDTVMWWLQQDNAARAEISRIDDRDELSDVLYDFRQWATKGGQFVHEVWGNGASSDNVWLANAYAALPMKAPWTFREDRCYRTLKNLFPWIQGGLRKGEHHALEDAKWQAEHCILLLKEKQRLMEVPGADEGNSHCCVCDQPIHRFHTHCINCS